MTPVFTSASVSARLERWPYKSPFRITGYDWTEAEVLVVELHAAGATGRGEASGIYYKGDTPQGALAQIESIRERLEGGVGHDELMELLPPGGARNALDCAIWELESQIARTPVRQLTGVGAVRALLSTYTIGAGSPEEMARGARDFADARALKLKLTGAETDAACVRAVRDARPDVWLGVDANQGFSPDFFREILPVLQEARVQLVEQPFAVGRESDMDKVRSPIPVAADESAQTAADLPALADRFDVVNIKLDKCGGLTAAFEMAARAKELGMRVMVGNMCGTSLAMAPAFLIGQLCDVVDLDGPLLLRDDRKPSVRYNAGTLWCGDDVWGYGE